MAQPYVGEIRMFAGNFAPSGWMMCEGQLLSIAEYETLFFLIGSTYGGNAETTFALPDLRGRVPVHMGDYFGTNYQLAEITGSEEVTLTINQIPSHTHSLITSGAIANASSPAKNILAVSTQISSLTESSADLNMSNSAINANGGSQPHDNMQPYLCINFIISLYGIFPSMT